MAAPSSRHSLSSSIRNVKGSAPNLDPPPNSGDGVTSLENDQRYRQLFEALPVALYMTDAGGRITLFNEAATELWGRAPELNSDKWCGSWRIFNIDGTPIPLGECPMASTLKSGVAVNAAELIIERPDGSRRFVLPHPQPLRDESGKLIGAINMLVDVTDRRLAESELAATKDHLASEVTQLSRLHDLAMRLAVIPELQPALQAVLETLVEAHGGDMGLVLLHDPASGLLCHKANVGFDEEILKDFPHALPGPYAGSCWTAFATKKRAVLESVDEDPRHARYREIARAVGFRMVHSTPIVTRSGEALGVVSVYFRNNRTLFEREIQFADVCARHAADAIEAAENHRAMRESENRFRQMADQAPVMIWVNNIEGCEFVNREYLRFVGGTPREVEKMNWTNFVHPDDLETYLGDYQRAFNKRKRFSAELRFRRVDGEYRWLRSSGVPRFDSEGTILGYVGCSVDFTENRRSEEALTQAKESAEAANLAKDKFLAVLSHELRTPLTPVLLAASALSQNMQVPASVREDAATIRDNIRLETKLIDDLLDLSRITSGKLRLQPELVDLNDAVLHVCGICRSQLEEKGIRLLCDFDENVDTTLADSARIQQIFWNLLSNAAKFTPQGGDVFVSTKCNKGKYEVRVRDNGIGIAPDLLPKVFDAFEQGNSGITRQFGGLGLGLAISNALVKLHGGSIRAESGGPGQGATFTVELPIQRRAATATPAEKPWAETPTGRALKLLVVEDHGGTAVLLQRMLKGAGYSVFVASDVAGAMELFEENEFDLVVSDLGLPDGTGYELMRAMRSRSPIKGIAISGYGMSDDIQKSQEAGFAEHLVKPVDVMLLEETIRRITRNGN